MFQSDAAYDSFMGRYSAPLAPVFADFVGVGPGDVVLDVGAGTGALTHELLRRSARVEAAEPSPTFVEVLRRRFPEVGVRAARAEELPWPDYAFDAALAQLVVTFMADPLAGIAEMRRVVRPGGTIGLCIWAPRGMELLDTIEETRRALGYERAVRADCTRDSFRRLLGPDAKVRELSVEALYRDFDDLWQSLIGGAGPHGAWVTTLGDADLVRVRGELNRRLGRPDGPFLLAGRAWAARAGRARPSAPGLAAVP